MRKRRFKCRHCSELFTPDCRHRRHQKFCSNDDCRKAAKTVNQRRWLSKPENQNIFKGPENVLRVQEWRKANPGYWKKKGSKDSALQDPCSSESVLNEQVSETYDSNALQDPFLVTHPVLVGIISLLMGDTLQDSIASLAKKLSSRGLEILGKTPKQTHKQGEDHEKTSSFKFQACSKDPIPI